MVFTTPGLAAQDIIERIRDGRIAPGDRLPEVELSTSLGLSRNSLREAFRVLAFAGVVEHIPNRGVFVIRPTVKRANDYYTYRKVVEVGALDYVHPGSPAMEKLEELITVEEPISYTIADFHQCIVDSVGSHSLSRSFEQIIVLSWIVALSFPEIVNRFPCYMETNRKIVDALAREDVAGARTLLHDYLDQACSEVIDCINGK
ncbi:MAG: GntR family transcriptional regulator [Corynebacterium sp.]|nr:GntR family transcriptional regulator [Corynebacterium sp.]